MEENNQNNVQNNINPVTPGPIEGGSFWAQQAQSPQQQAPASPLPTPPSTTPPPPAPEPLVPEVAHSFNDTNVKYAESGEPTSPLDAGNNSGDPVPVVRVLSVRGVEYGMMTISLWICAAALGATLLTIISGLASFEALAFPISLLIVALPVFAFFFLRLKKAETLNPSLALEPSKRRFSQVTQFLAFITCMINLIVFVYLVMASFGGMKVSWGKAIGDLAVVMVIAGGILAYYWMDEHKLAK